jgi:DNA repair protein RadA/Sms
VLAVLSRHANIGTGSADVFVNVVGGVRIDEPGADLAIALAVASAQRGIALGTESKPLACFGELGLTGELRTVAHPERRIEESVKFGLHEPVHPGSARTLRHALKSAFATAGETPTAEPALA